jgi:hypothetical protein
MAGPTVNPGDNVYFMSGRLLGQVAEVLDDGFAVVAGGQRVWLQNKVLFTAERGRVTLICEPDGLSNYELGPPN